MVINTVVQKELISAKTKSRTCWLGIAQQYCARLTYAILYAISVRHDGVSNGMENFSESR